MNCRDMREKQIKTATQYIFKLTDFIRQSLENRGDDGYHTLCQLRNE